MSKNKSYVAMDKFSLRQLKRALVDIIPDCSEYVFIDLGCGEGDALVKHRKMFKRCIGVENDKHTYQMCKLKTRLYGNIEVVLGSLETYSFCDVNTVLFMYDPLWLLSRPDAERLYSQCLTNCVQSITRNHQVYVACSMTSQNRLIVESILVKSGFRRLTINYLDRYNIKLYRLMRLRDTDPSPLVE